MEQQKNVKRTSSQVLELQQLIAAPLISTIEADAMSARKYLDFLMKFAFESFDPATGHTGPLRLVIFSYMEQDAYGTTHQREVRIPLLTLIPLPLLHIEEADFDFDIKIIDAITEKTEETFSFENGTMEDTGTKSPGMKMRASLAARSGKLEGELQQSLAANMKVRVRMRPSDMPSGLSNILHLAANNMSVIDAPEQPHNIHEEGEDDEK